jgi:hypothetical protein
MSSETLMPASLQPTDGQRMFVRYFTGCLIDLVILNLFVEYTKYVTIDTFTTSLLAAIVLQLLLKGTIAVEHVVGDYFKSKPGGFMKFMRYFSAWLVLFGSKFVILEAISMLFGKSLQFHGVFHGIVTLIAVVVAMLLAEEIVVRIYRRIGQAT